MPQSLSNVLIHLVFSTKDRLPLISESLKPDLHAYLASTSRKIGCECYRVGGVADHVHIALRMSRTLTLAKVVEELKSSSSRWAKSQGSAAFYWQSGYGVFSVSHRDKELLLDYIDRQAEHHRVITFQEEFRRLLEEHEIPFDEKYVWD